MSESTTENNTPEVSKSQRKRDAHELLDLGKKLISMPESRLKRLPMDDDLREEIEYARSIHSNGAKKRQMMTVGKMLRQRDNQALIEAVNDVQQKNRQENARFRHIEAWRNRLIEGDNQILSELIEQTPTINAQTLRQLIRNANKEIKLGKPPSASRKLFKLLREADQQSPLPPLPNN